VRFLADLNGIVGDAKGITTGDFVAKSGALKAKMETFSTKLVYPFEGDPDAGIAGLKGEFDKIKSGPPDVAGLAAFYEALDGFSGVFRNAWKQFAASKKN